MPSPDENISNYIISLLNDRESSVIINEIEESNGDVVAVDVMNNNNIYLMESKM